MNLLLDTHIALWAVTDDARLPMRAKDLIVDPGNDVWVSAASVWEIAIKHAKTAGRPGGLKVSAPQALSAFEDAGYGILPIQGPEAATAGALPPHHLDPFDRMLVAQALTTPLRLVTVDGILGRYSDTVIVV